MDAMTKTEHLEAAKKRAMFFVNQNNLGVALSSMMRDLAAHEGTKPLLEGKHAAAGVAAVKKGQDAVRQWVEGFQLEGPYAPG